MTSHRNREAERLGDKLRIAQRYDVPRLQYALADCRASIDMWQHAPRSPLADEMLNRYRDESAIYRGLLAKKGIQA